MSDEQVRSEPPASLDDMAMLIRMLVHQLRKANPDSKLPDRAVDYLRRKGLQGSVLRLEPAA